MKTILVNQIETYSNAIVTFNVLQGLAYSFYFGSNKMFNCLVKNSNLLAEVLTILFIVITILSVIAIKYFGNKKAELFSEYSNILITITRGKMVAVSLFGLFPAFLTFFYGALVEVPKMCEKLIA